LKGASPELKQTLLLDGSASDYRFTKNSNKNIDGVDDAAEFRSIKVTLPFFSFIDFLFRNLYPS
jgi:myosin protein heavy chain